MWSILPEREGEKERGGGGREREGEGEGGERVRMVDRNRLVWIDKAWCSAWLARSLGVCASEYTGLVPDHQS